MCSSDLEAPDYPPMFRAIGAEHDAMYRLFRESGLPWALVCTPRLVDGDATGEVRRLADYLPEGGGAVRTGDVAELLLELAFSPLSGRIGVNSAVCPPERPRDFRGA